MAETYLEITQQIEALKQKAESIRGAEIAGVVERIKSAIAAYGLTADQLFDAPAKAAAGAEPARRAGRVVGRGTGPRFRDDSGHSWSGRGPRPGWVKAALAAGKSLADFAIAAQGGSAPNGGSAKRAAGKSATPTPTAIKYKDDQGHSWSGRGPRPGWVKAALDAGKTLDQLT